LEPLISSQALDSTVSFDDSCIRNYIAAADDVLDMQLMIDECEMPQEELGFGKAMAKAFGGVLPMVSQSRPLLNSRSGDVSMAKHVQLKQASKFNRKRPKKTRPSDINRKRTIRPPFPDIPWITKIDKVSKAELPDKDAADIVWAEKFADNTYGTPEGWDKEVYANLVKQKTWYPRGPDVAKAGKKWYVVDASGMRLGRMAVAICKILLGKHKSTYTPGQLIGDFVIVINAEKVQVTGKKFDKKYYVRHSGRPGGLKAERFRDLQQRIPERIVEKAVRGMLPHNIYGRELFRRLKVFAGPEHPHEAQQPIDLTNHMLFGGLTSMPDRKKAIFTIIKEPAVDAEKKFEEYVAAQAAEEEEEEETDEEYLARKGIDITKVPWDFEKDRSGIMQVGYRTPKYSQEGTAEVAKKSK